MWWGRRELQLGNLTGANWGTHSQEGESQGDKSTETPHCVVGGLRVAQLRATSVVRQASGGSNNTCLRGVSVQNGVPGETHSWQALNSADGSLHLPQQAFSWDTGAGERSGEGDTRPRSEKPVECFEHMQAPHSHLQAVPSQRSSPSLLPSPSAPSPDILEHKAASVQSTGADNPR